LWVLKLLVLGINVVLAINALPLSMLSQSLILALSIRNRNIV
jgi:hypothetical protein